MFITRFSIRNYKQYKNETFEFKEGLNIIVGPNEIGKSTISSAILTCLYADVNTRSKAFIEDVTNWNSTQDKNILPQFELEFYYKDKYYFLRKNFQKKEVLLKTIDDSEEYTEAKSVDRKLKEILGIADEEIYKSTGFITQDDISQIHKSKNLLIATQNAVSNSGSDGEIQSVINQIEKEITELERGTKNLAKNPGPIKYFTDTKTKLQNELTNLNDLLNNFDDQKKRHQDLKVSVEKLINETDLLERLLKNNERYNSLKSRLDDEKTKLDKLSRDIGQVDEISARLLKEKSKLNNLEHLNQPQKIKIINNLRQIVEDLNKNMERHSYLKNDMIELEQRKPKIFKSPLLYIDLTLLIITIVFVALNITTVFPLVTGILSLLILIIIIYSNFLGGISREIKYLREKIHDLSDLITSDQSKIEKTLSELDFDSVEEVFNAKDEYKKIENDIKRLGELYDALLRNNSLEDLKKEQTRVFLEIKNIEENELSAEIKNSVIKGENYLVKSKEFERKKEELKKSQDELLVLENNLSNKNLDIEDLQDKEIELEEVEKNLEYYQHKLILLTELRMYISKAIEDTSTLVSTVLRKDIEKYFPKLTNNKHKNVRVDKNLNIEIYVEEKKEWLKPENKLSTGANDQLFFLTRLALFKIITKGFKPLLILDDPFVSFDEKRLKITLDILEEESKNYQIFLFSHDPFYRNYGNTIDLY